MPRTERHADDALRLRRAAIPLLAGHSTTAAFLDAAAGIGDRAWTVFLTMERCAGPLKIQLGAPHPVLDRFALTETQRTLSARARLHAVAEIARRHGWRVVALKGAVAAAEQTTSLLDVDLLATPEVAPLLLEELSSRIGLPPEGPVSRRHLATLGGDSMLAIEVHQNIDNRWIRLTEQAWNRIVPFAAVPGLYRLNPRDHVTHMLSHVVVDHPERRGRLRDSLLLLQGLVECSQDERKAIAAECERNPHRDALLKELRLAEGLGGDESAFAMLESEAFSRFWLFQRVGTGAAQRSSSWKTMENSIWTASMASVSGWPLWQMLKDGLHEPSAGRSEFGPTAFLERRLPRAGRGARVGLRALHYGIALAIGLPLGWRVKRAAHRAGVRTGG